MDSDDDDKALSLALNPSAILTSSRRLDSNENVTRITTYLVNMLTSRYRTEGNMCVAMTAAAAAEDK